MQIADPQLTPNFWLSEFIHSDKYPALANKVKHSAISVYKSFLMARLILQPGRDFIEMIVKITSGKCNQELNTAIGRNPFSTEHAWCHDIQNCAVDIVVLDDDGKENRNKTLELFYWMRDNLRDRIGQLIYYPISGHLHVSLASIKHFREVKVKIADGYVDVGNHEMFEDLQYETR